MQNSPVHGDWQASVARVDALIQKAQLSAASSECSVVALSAFFHPRLCLSPAPRVCERCSALICATLVPQSWMWSFSLRWR